MLVGLGPLVAGVMYFLYVACSDESPPLEPAGEFTAGTITVTGTDPTELPRGSTFDLQVFGTGFDERSTVSLTVSGSATPKVHTNGTRLVSPRQLSANITVAADAPGGPYDVVVQGRNGKQGVGTELVDAKLRLFEISPTIAEPGQDVHLAGSAFGSDRARVKVTFANSDGVIKSVSNNSLMVQVPFSVQPGDVEVRVKVQRATYDVTTHLAVQLGDPVVNSFRPSMPATGERVTIVGWNFGFDRDNVAVFFNSLSASVSSMTNTWIEVTVPDSTSLGDAIVQVWVGARSSNLAHVDVHRPKPLISVVGPSVALPGSEIAILGWHFGRDARLVTVKLCHSDRISPYSYFYYYGSHSQSVCYAAPVLTVTDNRIVVQLPSGIASDNYQVFVTVGNQDPVTASVFVL
jgi:hypothetical protein